MGGAWVGAVLVAGATSLPEITTNLSAVRQGTPNLALGDLFGAGMTNMLVLAIADLFTRNVRVLTRVIVNQALVGSLAISLTAIAAAGIITGHSLTIMGIGWAPLAAAIGYIGGMRLMHVSRTEPPFEVEPKAADQAGRRPLQRSAFVGFSLAALAILLAAPFLARSSADLAEILGLSTGFIGGTLLAITTTLPETVVVVASIRRASYDLAVGNLLGSNCFNMFILFVLDVADGPNSLLAQGDPVVLVGALFSMLLTGQVLLDVLSKSDRMRWYVEPGPVLLIMTYGLGVYLMYGA
jgi:cation:H+ antiporter